MKVGLIGTNQNLIGDKVVPTDRTTPDALTVQRLLAQMANAGCEYAVMEVSSHALMQSRVAGIHFRVGVFTNLTQDHLDYHGTMEAYCDAKARLFDQCGIACVNGDDPWTRRLLARFAGERVTFGQGMTNDLVGWRARYENDCVRFTACTDLDHEETRIGIPGGFSLYNALRRSPLCRRSACRCTTRRGRWRNVSASRAGARSCRFPRRSPSSSTMPTHPTGSRISSPRSEPLPMGA